jgi:raffinose/stachyose/melibiose transport system substrate-binding protein
MNNVIIKNDLFYDLKPWLDSKPELKKLCVESSVRFNTRSGKIVSMPMTVIRPIGLYYNKEMFQKAGITKPVSQMTFQEFDKALTNIKASGNKPLALMTGENAWTSMLLASAIFASQPGGAEVLEKQEVVTDYTSGAWSRHRYSPSSPCSVRDMLRKRI